MPKTLPGQGTQERRLLNLLVKGLSINRREAQKQYFNCLPTTISELSGRFGIKVSRKLEPLLGYNDHPVRYTRYWLEREEIERLKRLIEQENNPPATNHIQPPGDKRRRSNHGAQGLRSKDSAQTLANVKSTINRTEHHLKPN